MCPKYGWADGKEDSGTVEVFVDQSHLGLPIESAQHVRIQTEEDSVEIRVRPHNDCKEELIIWLSPLSAAVVPQDTVHRVRNGKLKVTLFKEKKKQKWFNLLGSGTTARRVPKTVAQDLDEADMAKLPTPSGLGVDNLPSQTRKAVEKAAEPARSPASGTVPMMPVQEPEVAVRKPKERPPVPEQSQERATDSSSSGAEARTYPTWVQAVEDGDEKRIVVTVDMQDLEILQGDTSVRVECPSLGGFLEFAGTFTPSWSRKKRTLTLR
jgi:hypothetical protein